MSIDPDKVLATAERRSGSARRVPNTGTVGEMETEARRAVSLTPASSIKPRPVRWLWSERVALGTLALLAGREGIGKSTLAYQLAADLTRGRLPGVYYGAPKAVIVAATEDSWEHTIVPRLMAAEADLERVFRVDVTTPEGFRGTLVLPSDIDALREQIAAVDAALVLLDPLISRLSPTLDTHRDAEVRQALEPLVALADRSASAVLGIIHVNKSASTDPLSLVMGSRAFPAVARAVLFVMTDPDNERVRIMGQPKNNLGRSDLPGLTFTIEPTVVATTEEGDATAGRIVWSGETARSVRDMLVAQGETSEERTAVSDASGWLGDYLAIHGVVDSQQVKNDARQAGHAERTLKRARQRIGAGTTAHGFPRRTYWSAPGMTPDQVDRRLSGQSVPGESPIGPTGLTGPTDDSRANGASGAVSPGIAASLDVEPL